MNIFPTVGQILRECRKNNNISMVDLSKRLGISVQMVCDVESGRKPLPDKYVDVWAEAVKEDPDLIVVHIWQKRLDDFNRNRPRRRKVCFKVVPVIEN